MNGILERNFYLLRVVKRSINSPAVAPTIATGNIQVVRAFCEDSPMVSAL
ncbi:hypothetical protein KJZ99_09290 [bacterium]|nr:hypothetical protein [bacterium]